MPCTTCINVRVLFTKGDTCLLTKLYAYAMRSGVTIIFGAPVKHSLHSLITVLIHNSGHFGPLYRFGLPIASYAAGCACCVSVGRTRCERTAIRATTVSATAASARSSLLSSLLSSC